MKKIGIPRALFYYKYYPLWESFFNELSVEMVVSGMTTKTILDKGVTNCLDEACLPVKVFHGHVMEIKDKVDFLFIPRFTSITKGEYICPKFGGLPDMVKSMIKELPPIISPEINAKYKSNSGLNAAIEIGHHFTDNISQIKKVYSKACIDYHKHSEHIRMLKKKTESKLNIVLLGHPYLIYDNFLNMDIIKKLERNDVNVITIDMLDHDSINELSRQVPKRIFWYFGRKALGSAFHISRRKDIAGVIYIMSFGCGIDSFSADLAERKIRNNSDIPFMAITIDEHTGQAGIDTRIEAFIDMIKWRKRDEDYIPAHG